MDALEYIEVKKVLTDYDVSTLRDLANEGKVFISSMLVSDTMTNVRNKNLSESANRLVIRGLATITMISETTIVCSATKAGQMFYKLHKQLSVSKRPAHL